MKGSITIYLVGLLLAPALAWGAQVPQWTGIYVGANAGLNRSNYVDSATAPTVSIFGGYNQAIMDHLVVGGDVFYTYNKKRDVGVLSIGSNVFGAEGVVGYQLDMTMSGSLTPYAKVGVGHLTTTGDVSDSSTGVRFGVGVLWRFSKPLSVTVQLMHQDSSIWQNDDLTAGVVYHF